MRIDLRGLIGHMSVHMSMSVHSQCTSLRVCLYTWLQFNDCIAGVFDEARETEALVGTRGAPSRTLPETVSRFHAIPTNAIPTFPRPKLALNPSVFHGFVDGCGPIKIDRLFRWGTKADENELSL